VEPPLSSQPEWRITTTGRPASHFEISCPFRKPSFIDLQTVLRRARPADRETPSTERLVTWTFTKRGSTAQTTRKAALCLFEKTVWQLWQC
jgi:hypothetical protein